jgi:hypothetical protein
MAVRAQYTTTLLMLLPSCASRCDDDGFAQPRWQVSSAWPHHRDVASAVEGIVGAAFCQTRCATKSLPTSFGLTKCVMRKRSPHYFLALLMSAPARQSLDDIEADAAEP